MIVSAFNTWAQSVPNGGFENWNVTSYNDLMYWYCSNEDNKGNPVNVTRVTDSYHGTYAALLSTVMTGTNLNFAFIANGDPMNIKGQGVPYNQQATGFSFRYKCNIMTNDSALVWIIFKKSGAKIGEYIKKVTGTQTNYTLGSMTFSLSQSPDSIIFAAASSNPFNYTGPAGSTFQLDSMLFTGVSSQPLNFNGSFEQWQMVNSALPLGWNISSGSNANYFQTNDAYSGSYALQLVTNMNSSYARADDATSGTPTPSTTIGGNPFTNQNDSLIFYYKYAPSNSNDSAQVQLGFKKLGNYFQFQNDLLPASPSYIRHKININLSQTPDTLVIWINSSKNWSVAPSYAGAVLKIDNMYLTSQVVPVSDFTMPTACGGQMLQLFDNSSNLPTAYSWTLAGATPSTSTSQNPGVTYSTPGTYTIMHTASNSSGPGNVVIKTITVNATPTLSVTGPNTICTGNIITLNVTGASTYTWMAGPNTSTIAVSPTITTSYSVAGTTAGCMNTAYMTVTVNPTPTVSVTGPNTTCSGNMIILNVTGANTYTWAIGPNTSTIAVSPTITSSYSVTGTDIKGCTNTAYMTVTVNPSPTITAISNTSLICVGQSATLTANGGTSYTWTPGGVASSIVISPTISGTYSLVGKDANGCTNTTQITQSVSACTGINSYEQEKELVVYPNPGNGTFTVKSAGNDMITISNEMGQVISTKELNENNDHKVQIDGLSQGVYFVIGRFVKTKLIVVK